MGSEPRPQASWAAFCIPESPEQLNAEPLAIAEAGEFDGDETRPGSVDAIDGVNRATYYQRLAQRTRARRQVSE